MGQDEVRAAKRDMSCGKPVLHAAAGITARRDAQHDDRHEGEEDARGEEHAVHAKMAPLLRCAVMPSRNRESNEHSKELCSTDEA